jgi:hypothetical protein
MLYAALCKVVAFLGKVPLNKEVSVNLVVLPFDIRHSILPSNEREEKERHNKC